MAYSSGKAQAPTLDDIDVFGISLLWDYGTGVENHNFEVCVLPLDGDSDWSCLDFTTQECNVEVYEGTHQAATNYDNALRVLPYSENDYYDYVDGVTTADIVKMSRNRLNIEPFDNPYKFVSGDVDYDYDVDADDEDAVLDLIFGYITEFQRTSWEWFNAWWVDHNYSTFEANPYLYTINEDWPGGIIYGGLTYSALTNPSNLTRYYDFRTTKIGDVYGCSSTSLNSWVCRSCYSLKNDKVETRFKSDGYLDKSQIPNIFIKAGTSFDVKISIDEKQKLLGFQLPLILSSQVADVSMVNQYSTLPLKYHFNKDLKELIFVWYDKNSIPVLFLPENNIITFRLLIKKDIENLNELFITNDIKPIEFIDEAAETTNNKFKIRVDNFSTEILDIRLNNSNSRILEIISSSAGIGHIQLLNIQGQSVCEKSIDLENGINNWNFPENLIQGIYMARIIQGENSKSFKFQLN